MNERLKEIRLEKGFTQKQLAIAVGLTETALCNYEKGIREPSLDVFKQLCIVLEVSSDYLLGLTDDY